MLIPQFSLRWLLGAITAFAGFFLIVSLAAGGRTWAVAISVAVSSLAVAIAVYAAMFFVVWLFSLVMPVRSKPATPTGQSPFASNASITQQST